MHTASRTGIARKSYVSICALIRNINQTIFLLACVLIAGCGGGGGSGTATPEATNLVGSVGDGPITGATITVNDADGNLVGTVKSDASATYKISVPGGTAFPVTISATGGTDLVTGTSPDFTMVSVALKKADLNSKKRTVNINPFSTFIVYMSQSMPGGLTTQNIEAAKQTIFQKFNFGLDPTYIADPISSDINDINIAGIVKSSEALGEMIRRTRDAIITSGNNVDGDDVINALANDLADGAFDGTGVGSNSVISATAKIVTAKVLIEVMRNQLKVNNSVATTELDNAIQITRPASSMTTADVALTDGMLLQTQSALAAAQRFAPSPELSSLSNTVAGLTSTVTISDVNAALPAGSEDILDTSINLVPLATTVELASINAGNGTTSEPVAPVITSTAVLTAKDGVAYRYDVNATDANSGSILTYMLTSAPSGMTINATSGLISWTPTASQVGTQDVSVRVTDNGSPALSATQGFSIAVTADNVTPDNVAPVITSTAVLTAKDGVAYLYDVNATDSNSSDNLNYALMTAPAGMSINASSGLISWTPTASQVGTQDVSVRVTDNGSPALSASQGFSIAVQDSRTTIRINAGGGEYVDSKGRLWAADYGYNLGGLYSRTDAINGTVDDALYQSEHWHSEWQDATSPELEYRFNLPSGNYAVKLYFAEVTQSVTRIFDVEIEGQLVIDNLDIASEAGRYNAMIKNIATTVNDGELHIRFPRDTQSPKISAIEIVPVKTLVIASTSNSNPVSILIPEANQGTGTLSIDSEPANGTAVVSGDNITYTPNVGFGGQDTIIYRFIDENGSVTLSTITVTVTCNSCVKEAKITLSWQANVESISGYRIYYGPDSSNATELISDIALNSGLIDPTMPQLEYAATSDLNYYSGEQVCFKVQAYTDSESSALSDAICGTI